jgi:hypothetical protein
MCIRHHTHCSVESVTERGAAAPPLSSACGRGRQGVKLEQHTCLSRASRIGGTVRNGLKACNSETSTAQYIIYNIKKWGCLIARVVQRKPTLLDVTWRFLFPPPSRPEKNIHNLPKTPSHQDFLITHALPQGQIPGTTPIYE